MFEPTDSTRSPATEPPVASTADVVAWITALAGPDSSSADADRVDHIRALEELKAAASAAQVRATAALDTSQRSQQADAGVPAAKRGCGIAAQVGLARRESPVRGAQHLGLAKMLVHEMPHTLAALTRGVISEWRATLVVRETACLTREHRALVDRTLAGDPDQLQQLSDKGLVNEVKKLAYQLDPESVMNRTKRAHTDRRVTIRPAPDTMSLVSGFLPAVHGVAVYAALTRHADALKASGDHRSRGQIMADTFIERLTQTATSGAGAGSGSGHPADPSKITWADCDSQRTSDPDQGGSGGSDPGTGASGAGLGVEIQLVITDRALFGADDEPAFLHGYGPIPAGLARAIAADPKLTAWVRRLYADPDTGQLVELESRRRLFSEGLRRFLEIRDQICRTPWCDAPIRHADHVTAHQDGGPTSGDNGQGLCEGCNYAKQAPGWNARPSPGPEHTVTTTTPTGHEYASRAPALTRSAHRFAPGRIAADLARLTGVQRATSQLEAEFAERLNNAA